VNVMSNFLKINKTHKFAAAIIMTICLALSPAPLYAQAGIENADPETARPVQTGPMTNAEFRALAGAQIAAIAFMSNHYLLDKGEYPPTFYDLMASGYWLADMDNIFTGEPLEEVDYIPQPSDYASDMSGTYLEINTSADQSGGGAGASPNGVPPAPQAPPMPRIQKNVIKIDPNKIGPFEPGDVLLFARNDSSLQIVIWMDREVFVEHLQTSPYDNSITRHLLGRRTHATDDVILAGAVLIEQVLPREYGKLQFARNEDPILPRDMPLLTWEQRENIFRELSIYPRNPLTRTRVERVKSFRIGMIADLGDASVPPVYCMEGGRLRTLKEMTDLKFLAANQNEVKRREIAFGVIK
jgi:hypothetical protein